MKFHASKYLIVCLIVLAAAVQISVQAFAPATTLQRLRTTTSRAAGGFEWEDPGETFDQGVENPFNKAELSVEDGLKIDPARLLSPRMNGSNIYLVGMMGSGKSAVGKIVAKRKYLCPNNCFRKLRSNYIFAC